MGIGVANIENLFWSNGSRNRPNTPPDMNEFEYLSRIRPCGNFQQHTGGVILEGDGNYAQYEGVGYFLDKAKVAAEGKAGVYALTKDFGCNGLDKGVRIVGVCKTTNKESLIRDKLDFVDPHIPNPAKLTRVSLGKKNGGTFDDMIVLQPMGGGDFGFHVTKDDLNRFGSEINNIKSKPKDDKLETLVVLARLTPTGSDKNYHRKVIEGLKDLLKNINTYNAGKIDIIDRKPFAGLFCLTKTDKGLSSIKETFKVKVIDLSGLYGIRPVSMLQESELGETLKKTEVSKAPKGTPTPDGVSKIYRELVQNTYLLKYEHGYHSKYSQYIKSKSEGYKQYFLSFVPSVNHYLTSSGYSSVDSRGTYGFLLFNGLKKGTGLTYKEKETARSIDLITGLRDGGYTPTENYPDPAPLNNRNHAENLYNSIGCDAYKSFYEQHKDSSPTSNLKPIPEKFRNEKMMLTTVPYFYNIEPDDIVFTNLEYRGKELDEYDYSNKGSNENGAEKGEILPEQKFRNGDLLFIFNGETKNFEFRKYHETTFYPFLNPDPSNDIVGVSFPENLKDDSAISSYDDIYYADKASYQLTVTNLRPVLKIQSDLTSRENKIKAIQNSSYVRDRLKNLFRDIKYLSEIANDGTTTEEGKSAYLHSNVNRYLERTGASNLMVGKQLEKYGRRHYFNNGASKVSGRGALSGERGRVHHDFTERQLFLSPDGCDLLTEGVDTKPEVIVDLLGTSAEKVGEEYWRDTGGYSTYCNINPTEEVAMVDAVVPIGVLPLGAAAIGALFGPAGVLVGGALGTAFSGGFVAERLSSDRFLIRPQRIIFNDNFYIVGVEGATGYTPSGEIGKILRELSSLDTLLSDKKGQDADFAKLKQELQTHDGILKVLKAHNIMHEGQESVMDPDVLFKYGAADDALVKNQPYECYDLLGTNYFLVFSKIAGVETPHLVFKNDFGLELISQRELDIPPIEMEQTLIDIVNQKNILRAINQEVPFEDRIIGAKRDWRHEGKFPTITVTQFTHPDKHSLYENYVVNYDGDRTLIDLKFQVPKERLNITKVDQIELARLNLEYKRYQEDFEARSAFQHAQGDHRQRAVELQESAAQGNFGETALDMLTGITLGAISGGVGGAIVGGAMNLGFRGLREKILPVSPNKMRSMGNRYTLGPFAGLAANNYNDRIASINRITSLTTESDSAFSFPSTTTDMRRVRSVAGGVINVAKHMINLSEIQNEQALAAAEVSYGKFNLEQEGKYERQQKELEIYKTVSQGEQGEFNDRDLINMYNQLHDVDDFQILHYSLTDTQRSLLNEFAENFGYYCNIPAVELNLNAGMTKGMGVIENAIKVENITEPKEIEFFKATMANGVRIIEWKGEKNKTNKLPTPQQLEAKVSGAEKFGKMLSEASDAQRKIMLQAVIQGINPHDIAEILVQRYDNAEDVVNTVKRVIKNDKDAAVKLLSQTSSDDIYDALHTLGIADKVMESAYRRGNTAKGFDGFGKQGEGVQRLMFEAGKDRVIDKTSDRAFFYLTGDWSDDKLAEEITNGKRAEKLVLELVKSDQLNNKEELLKQLGTTDASLSEKVALESGKEKLVSVDTKNREVKKVQDELDKEKADRTAVIALASKEDKAKIEELDKAHKQVKKTLDQMVEKYNTTLCDIFKNEMHGYFYILLDQSSGFYGDDNDKIFKKSNDSVYSGSYKYGGTNFVYIGKQRDERSSDLGQNYFSGPNGGGERIGDAFNNSDSKIVMIQTIKPQTWAAQRRYYIPPKKPHSINYSGLPYYDGSTIKTMNGRYFTVTKDSDGLWYIGTNDNITTKYKQIRTLDEGQKSIKGDFSWIEESS